MHPSRIILLTVLTALVCLSTPVCAQAGSESAGSMKSGDVRNADSQLRVSGPLLLT